MVTDLGAERARRRGLADDGRCWTPPCAGHYRAVCEWRGQHPEPPCAHPETRTRTFLMHGLVEDTVVECVACGAALGWPDTPWSRLLAAVGIVDKEVAIAGG